MKLSEDEIDEVVTAVTEKMRAKLREFDPDDGIFVSIHNGHVVEDVPYLSEYNFHIDWCLKRKSRQTSFK